MSDSRSRTAVVIGAGQGIGKAVALTLARHNTHVYLVGRTRSKLEDAALEIQALGGHCSIFSADLTHETTLNSLNVFLEDAGACLDILVNCAGEALLKPIDEVTFADWERIIAVNLTTSFVATRALLPFLRKSENPSIILVSSKVAMRGYPTVTAYTAAKAGVVGFARALAYELREEQIRVTALCPGPVDTPMRRAATPHINPDYVISADTVAETIWHIINLPRGTMTGEILLQSELYD